MWNAMQGVKSKNQLDAAESYLNNMGGTRQLQAQQTSYIRQVSSPLVDEFDEMKHEQIQIQIQPHLYMTGLQTISG